MTDNQYETVLDAIDAAAQQDFRFSFSAEPTGLRCLETGQLFSPAQLVIEAFHRIEGATDPEESAIVYLIKTTTGIKGTLTDAFGIYENANISALINTIPIDRRETAGSFDNKRCLNCGTVLQGHYCYHCGQKDEPLHEPFYVMLAHAVAHYWHFDGKFMNTLGPLVFKPGFLSKEFMEGRRVRYVHPIQLYLFISIVFFIAFSFLATGKLRNALNEGELFTSDSMSDAFDATRDAINLPQVPSLPASPDNVTAPQFITAKTADTNSHALVVDGQQEHTTEPSVIKIREAELPLSIAAYNDSINRLMPEKRPGKLQQAMDRLIIHLNTMDEKEAMERFTENVTHNLPKLMFVLIPVFALLLKLIFIRRKIYFVDHAVFTLHFHAFAFLAMLLLLMLYFATGFAVSTNWLMLLLMIYLFLAMKNCYRLSGFNTLRKLVSLSVLYFIALLMTVVLYLMVAIITV